MAEHKSLQRLYLAKGEKEDRTSTVYVDTPILPQHQYDGIRFLYRQFKKGKAGVILNDPSGYGKRVQTVLFLSAIREIITQPILIVCTEGNEKLWLQQFHQWTSMISDIHVLEDNEYTTSMCVICTIPQSHVLSRNEWDILVVDDHGVTRESLRAGFNVKYKIWITSYDMKKHLQTFSYVYRWLYPNDKFEIGDAPSNKKPTAMLHHSVRVDAFMEDLVLRRRDVAVPLGKYCEPPTERRQVTRKNKDATGKKIKRSKPGSCHDSSTESQETGSEHNTSAESDKNGEVDGKASEDFEVNIEEESKIDDDVTDDEIAVRPNRNTKSKIKASAEDFEVNIEDKNQSKIDDEIADIPNRNTKSNVEKSGDDKIRENPNEMDVDVNPIDELPKSDSTTNSEKQNNLTIFNSDPDSQSLIIKFDSETQDDEIENCIPDKKSKITNEIVVSEDLFSTDIVSSERCAKLNNHKTKANSDITDFTVK